MANNVIRSNNPLSASGQPVRGNATGPVVPLKPITTSEFWALRDLVYQRFGINLTEQKQSLVTSRLQALLSTQGFSSFADYYRFLLEDRTNQGLDELINRISTNFSYFYRESTHFDFFVKIALPQLLKDQRSKGGNDIRIWTAGCSTGEEPYMLIMLMMEALGLEYTQWSAGLLATDISERVLTIASQGVYPEDRVSRVPANLRQKYFRPAGAGLVAVHERVKSEITLRRFNLMNTEFPFKKPFHMIFCRNVMIYFDKPTRDALIRRFHQITEPGGYLFIGHSETISRDQNMYKYVMPACYQRMQLSSSTTSALS